jgi:hypothetical protein
VTKSKFGSQNAYELTDLYISSVYIMSMSTLVNKLAMDNLAAVKSCDLRISTSNQPGIGKRDWMSLAINKVSLRVNELQDKASGSH